MCRAHRLNEYSSRSHCVMTLHIETGSSLNSSQGRRPGSAADPAHMRRFGKLVLVDLAGSERLKVNLTAWSARTGQMGSSVQNSTSLWVNDLSSACSLTSVLRQYLLWQDHWLCFARADRLGKRLRMACLLSSLLAALCPTSMHSRATARAVPAAR